MTEEAPGNNSGCESFSHEQHLCYMVSQGFHLTDEAEYQALVKDPEFKCQNCGRLAKSKISLCKPVRLSPDREACSEGLRARMMKSRSVGELLDVAIIRETEAQELYIKMASMVENPWMDRVLKGFAREEQLHRAKLEAVKAGEIVLELEEIGELGIEDRPENIVPYASMSYPELLAYAIKKEEGSHRLYESMASLFSEPGLKDTFLKLAQEEANHRRRLEIEYDLMTS